MALSPTIGVTVNANNNTSAKQKLKIDFFMDIFSLIFFRRHQVIEAGGSLRLPES